MKKRTTSLGKIYSQIILLLIFSGTLELKSQITAAKGDGIEVIIADKSDRKLNSYFMINGGYQTPYLVAVPMIPENTAPENYSVNTLNGMQALTEGYSFGLGVFNKTKSWLEVGLLVDYYNNSIAITKAGERSMGPWVLEQTNNASDLTDPFDEDQNRVSEVYVIRACVRLKLPLGPVRLWGGIAGGSYTSTVRYTGREAVTFFNSATKTLIAPSYQLGMDFMIHNKRDKDILSFTFYADFSSPKMEESIYDAVVSGWDFEAIGGNKVISPVRIGLAIGFH
jgi:hypothetical protein